MKKDTAGKRPRISVSINWCNSMVYTAKQLSNSSFRQSHYAVHEYTINSFIIYFIYKLSGILNVVFHNTDLRVWDELFANMRAFTT